MQLTQYTDYSLRVLIYLATVERGGTIGEIADRFGISKNHLVKVAHHLGKLGYIDTQRGRSGGLRLSLLPSEINLGQVVRDVEPHFHLVECMNAGHNACIITPSCLLRPVLEEAQEAMLGTLGRYTLADVVSNQEALLAHFVGAEPS